MTFTAQKITQMRAFISLTCCRVLAQKHYIHTTKKLMAERKGDQITPILIIYPTEVIST